MTISALYIPSRDWTLVYTRTQGLADDTCWLLEGSDPNAFDRVLAASDTFSDALAEMGLTEVEIKVVMIEAQRL